MDGPSKTRGQEIHEALVALAMQGFDRVLADALPRYQFETARRGVASEVRERMAQAAQALAIEIELAREEGEALGEEKTKTAIARGMAVVAGAQRVPRDRRDEVLVHGEPAWFQGPVLP